MGKCTLLSTAIAVFGCAGNYANAYDWNSDYGADLTIGYEDNFRLSNANEIDTTSNDLGLFMDLEGMTEISNIRLALGANSLSYSDSSIDSQTNYNLLLDTSRTGEYASSFLKVLLESESTTQTELLDSGRLEDGTRDSVIIEPGLSYQADERNSYSVNLSFKDVSYDTVSLTEYTDNSVSLSWSYRLDETDSVSTSVRSSVYDPDVGKTTDTNSISLGYELKSSEVTTYNLSIGYSEVDRPEGSDSSGDYAFGVNYRTDERNNFDLELSNAYEASGEGEVREEDRLHMRWIHGLSERSQFTLSAEGVSDDVRDYFSIEAGSTYQYTREINLSARYRYREQDENSDKADSSALFFSISYSPI